MPNFSFDPGSKFLDPQQVLFSAGLSSNQTFVDMGAGSGFYSIAAAKIVGDQGQIYSVDILETALDHIAAEARLQNVRNIKTHACDLEKPNSCDPLPAASADMVLFANIIHQIKD